MENIGDRIKLLRKKECQMTQKEFAARLGVTNAHISKIEKGLTIPSEALIKLICKCFCVSEHWIKEGLMPMYMEQIEDEADRNLTVATKQLRKLLSDNDPLVRLTTSQLEDVFVRILCIENIDACERVHYLKALLRMFTTINDTLSVFKTTYPISENVKKEILQSELEDVESSLQALVKIITENF